MDDSVVIPQSERSQLRARRLEIGVKNAANPQAFRDPDEHRGIFDIDDLLNRRLGDVQRKPEDIRVGLSDMDEAGGNEEIDQPVQFELSNPIGIQFPGFVADHGDLQPVPDLELSDQLDHLGVRFRLREHEAPKLRPGERPLLVEDYLA